jgi:hypothetical protein
MKLRYSSIIIYHHFEGKKRIARESSKRDIANNAVRVVVLAVRPFNHLLRLSLGAQVARKVI